MIVERSSEEGQVGHWRLRARGVCGAVGVCLTLAATWSLGQGLGTVAARERAKRERGEAKPAAKAYDDASLKTRSGSGAPEPAAPPAPAEPAAEGGERDREAGASREGAEPLPICGGFEMLQAWSEAHKKYARECGGGPRAGTSGRFDIELVVGASGRVESASVTPETPYTTCVAGKMRGHSMPAPAEGKRCRAPYQAVWNL
jgi:hypothetical protein